jgi:hypothetical protein
VVVKCNPQLYMSNQFVYSIRLFCSASIPFYVTIIRLPNTTKMENVTVLFVTFKTNLF